MRGLRLNICQPLDQYANVRPARILPGIKSPLSDVTDKDLDWDIVRENSDGEYSGQGDAATVASCKKSPQISCLYPRWRLADYSVCF